MNRVLEELFKRQKLFIFLFLIVLGYGIYAYFVIPKQEMPEIDTPYMLLSVTAPSMSATDIEKEIVDDIEKLLLTYEDVTETRSIIYDNYAVIITTYSFSLDDPSLLSKEIFEKVGELSLPEAITEIKYESEFDDPHIIFSVHSDTLSEVELLHHAENFKNELLLLDEVHLVEIDSPSNNEVLIELDQSLLDMYQLSLLDVYQILYANTTNIPLGSIDTEYGSISLSGNIEIDELEELEEIVIIPVPLVQLKDVASISIEDTSTKSYYFNNEKSVFLSLYFNEDIDFTKLGDEVLNVKESYISEHSNGYEIDEMLFLPDYVESQINDVFYSLLIAIVVVMVVVLIGIGVRNSLLVVVTIPIIISGTIGLLYISGFELHKLTIVGLIVSIGILVDNQIVITEGIKRNIDNDLLGNKIQSAKKAIRDNLMPVLSSTLTTIAAFIVIVLLPGFLGKIVSSMPLTVIITISLSFIVSMVLSPILAVLFLKRKPYNFSTSVHEVRIKKMIQGTLKYPIVWILISILLLGGSGYLVYTNQQIDLYPNDERGVLYIDYSVDFTSFESNVDVIKNDIISELESNDHMLHYAYSVGGDLPHFHFSNKLMNDVPYNGRFYVTYDYSESELQEEIKSLEQSFKDIDGVVTVNTLELSPPIAPVRVFIEDDNKDMINTVLEELLLDIDDSENIKTYSTVENVKSLKYQISYNSQVMASKGITKVQIDQVIATYVNGLELDIFTYNEETISVHIDSSISSIEEINSISLRSPFDNQDYPLSAFVTFTAFEDYSVINRLNGNTVSIIDLYPSNIDNFAVEDEIKGYVSDIDLVSTTVKYGGENDMFEEISGDLLRASIIAIVLIFIIMFIQFNNFIKPLIILLTIPLTFTGSFLFILLFNSPITATGLVGMVSLLGVTVNTGILLVEYISRKHQDGLDIKDACIDSVYLRFRPIMLTSVTTILGLIPLLITGGNFFRPLAITFMGGLVTSTLMTLFLIPSVYYLVYKKR